MTRSPATRRGRAGLSLLFAVALMACDTTTTPNPATPAPGATTATTAPVATDGAAGPTPAADAKLPSGAQFARGATSISGEAEPVVTQFLTRAYFFATKDKHPEALYRESVDWIEAEIDDGAGYKPQAGSSLDGPFRVVAAAANDHAMVVLGASTTTDHDRPTGLDRLPESLIWVTTDGKAFTRMDPHTVIPGTTGLRLVHVAATAAGFVIVGNALPSDGTAGDIVVLTSADGAAWKLAARIDGEGTLATRGLFVDGTRLLIDATDQQCDTRGLSFYVGIRTGVTRAWTSTDGGATWQALDLQATGSVLGETGGLIEGCPTKPILADLIGIARDLDTDGRIVGLAGGALFARSRDGTRMSVSTDLATWQQVPLPDAIAVPEDGRRPYAQKLVLDVTGPIRTDGTLALLALEDRPDLPGRPKSGGCQVHWWRTTDRGAAWTTGPLGRPLITCATATWSFEQLLDGSVVLFADAIIANTNRGEASFRTGTPGDLIRWDTCTPGPDADCAFATIAKPTSEAPDWPGINLSGATINDAAIGGVQMPKAIASASLLSGTFGAADLREALLSYAVLEGDFRGADLEDAYLFHAIIRADLTGANLDGAELTGATFEAGAVCPDGKAPASGATDAKAACRL